MAEHDLDTVDVVLLDLGGVVFDIDFRRALAHWAAAASCDAAVLGTRLSHDDAGLRYETGRLSDTAFFENLRVSLGINLPDEALLDGWNAIFAGEMPGIAGVLAKAAGRWPLYAFSNTNPAHQAYFSRRFAAVLGHFRRVFVSSDIGLRKPDADAFRFVVNAIGVPAPRILFFDDILANVEGARACGIRAVHVTGHTTVPETLVCLEGDLHNP
ncbi:MAG: HAD family phosphatase [Bradyrhizobiaceae bacterium]|nr:HAD family phosphatase [Bradyrhizobiaceae bacterium]